MYKIIYPKKDATLYERSPSQNTGVDQILELTKDAVGEPVDDLDGNVQYYEASYNSRILFYFDLSSIFSEMDSKNVSTGSFKSYLTLKAMSADSLPLEYTLEVRPVSGSWLNGTGYYNNNPIITNGVSWYYRTSKENNQTWRTSSFVAGSTGSFSNISGGGTWYTASVCTQSFNYESPDCRIDVTNIVRAWKSGLYPNDGFILKRPTEHERDSNVYGSLKYFALDSHTVFLPKLEIVWNDSVFSGTSSFEEINDNDYVIYSKNIKDSYKTDEKVKIRFGCRDKYPTHTYSTSSAYLTNVKRLPTSSYFSVVDFATDVPFVYYDTTGSVVNCDTNGNYIYLDMNSFMPERYYKIVFKMNFSETVEVVDSGFYFKITR